MLSGFRISVLLTAAMFMGNVAFATEVPGAFKAFSFSAHVGYLGGVANEYVYRPDGSKLSHLIWDMDGNIAVNGDIEWKASDRLKLFSSFSAGFDGNNSMKDYDWEVAPYADWSDRSIHGKTQLDHYFSIDAGANYGLVVRDTWALSAIGGFKYTDVKWTAYGGDYIYSRDGGFRNEVGSSSNGEKMISYQLMLPAFYAGLGIEHQIDSLMLSLSAVGGLSFSGQDKDNHWARTPPRTFLEEFGTSPFLGLRSSATYALSDSTSILLAVKYDYFFTMQGSTTMVENGVEIAQIGGNAAGASLEAVNVSAGIKYDF